MSDDSVEQTAAPALSLDQLIDQLGVSLLANGFEKFHISAAAINSSNPGSVATKAIVNGFTGLESVALYALGQQSAVHTLLHPSPPPVAEPVEVVAEPVEAAPQ